MITCRERWVLDYITCGNKTTLLHHPTRGGIVCEMSTQERGEGGLCASIMDHSLKGLCADASVPEFLTYPVAHNRFSAAAGKETCDGRAIADGSHQCSALAEHHCPGGTVGEEAADDGPALLHRAVGSPSCAGAHFWVAGQEIEVGSVRRVPRAQEKSVAMQCDGSHRVNGMRVQVGYQ